MAQLADMPFYSSNDDDLFHSFNPSSTNLANDYSSTNVAYNQFVANNINSSAEILDLLLLTKFKALHLYV